MDKEIIKVEFHLADGTTKWITGEDLEKWNQFNFQVAQFCEIHNMNPDWEGIKWEYEYKIT